MPGAPLPANEAERLSELRSLNLLDSPPEEAFDKLTRTAALLCDAPMSVVSLVDAGRQWFKSRVGIDVQESARDDAFCAYVVADNQELVVSDASLDPRFEDNRFVVGDPGLRAYAGMPVRSENGLVLGTLCVLDTKPRQFSPRELEILRTLADQVAAQIQLRYLQSRLFEAQSLVLADHNENLRQVAVELHDGVCQDLAGVTMLLNCVTQNAVKLDAELHRDLKEIQASVEATLTDCRNLAQNEPAFHVWRDGLIASVSRMAAKMASDHNIAIECRLDSAVAATLSSREINHVYRLTQEALRNVCVHSGGSRAWVFLSRESGDIVLRIADDGRGVADLDSAGTGLGFSSMLFRARSLGGTLEVRNNPERGLSVSLKFQPRAQNDTPEFATIAARAMP